MSLLTSAPISSLAIELLRRSLVLVNTVSRVPAGELSGPSGGTVTVRVPVPRAAREQATPSAAITYDETDEVPVDVAVKHWYNGGLVSDEELTLELQDYGRQILLPQVESVARAAEDELAGAMNGLTPDAGIEFAATPDPDADDATVLAIREQLTVNEVPAGDRYVAVAPDIVTRLLSIPKFVQAADRGDGGSALAEAIIGRVYGLTFVESSGLDAGAAVGYHRSGFAFASARPNDPGGGAIVSIANEGGIQLRHVQAFDPGHLSTAAVTSVFAGASVVDGNDGSPVTLATSESDDDIIDTATAHGYEAGDRVHFPTLTGGTGLSVGTTYYVIAANLGETTFKVSATEGGSAVNFTTDITAGTVVKALPRAFKVGTGS